jgi:hypothetical protein
VDCASGEEAVKLEGTDACCIIESAVLSEDVRDLVGRLPTDITGRYVGFGKFGFEEGTEEE